MVSVFLSGRPLWVNPHMNASDAFVAAWLPGSEGAGVADVLLRDAEGGIRHEFTGRLSFSWPAEADQTDLNVHSGSYEPLFAYGYGLSADDTVVVADNLPEQGIEIKELSDLELLVQRVQPPWILFAAKDPVNLGESTETWETYAIRDLASPQEEGFPSVRKADRNAQEDSLAIRWQGGTPGALGFVQDFINIDNFQANDLSEFLLSRGAIRFDIMLKSGDPSGLAFGMGCGLSAPGCYADIDLSELISAERDTGQWRSIRVELECLSREGMDFTNTGVPFFLSADSEVEVLIHDVRITRGAENAEPAKCEAERFIN